MAELDEKSFHDLGSQTNLDHDTPSSSSDQHQIHLAKSAPTLSELEELLDPELESAISITKIINSHPTTCPGDRLGLEEGRGADVKDPQGETGWFNSIDPCSHSPFKQHITSTIDCPQPTSSFGYKSRARTGPMPDTLPHWTILERKKDTITGLPFLKIVTSTESLLEECPGTLFWTTLTPPFGRETRETPRTANFTAQTFELNITKCVKQAYPLYKKISSPKAAQSLFSLSCLGIGIPLVSRLGAEELMLIPLISRFPTPNREAGRRYQQILKPEDLRQDALVMQLHRLASMALHNNESTRKWGLQVNQWFELLLQDLNFRSKGRWKKKNNLVIFEGILKVALEAICKRADGIMEILKIITFNCPKPIDEAFKHTQSTRTPEEFRDQLLQAIDACLIDKTTIEERTSKLV
ncbi:hypothetical protein KEM48_014581 [Puccinia striiformis f. sp. tritici PST-130]|nr:hypothetical protein KEM48_014581 [Puccinia striiformis f. sp. tritici PST-130]